MERRIIVIGLLALLVVCAQAAFPSASGSQGVSSTIQVSGVYDGGMKRFYGTGDLGSGGQNEDQDPLFNLASGATLQNVILGAPAADGVHCAGACTIRNVWWEDVGEDAATFRGSSGSIQQLVTGGGARAASDKVFQHNGAGTLTIENFEVSDFGKLYRSCGNCGTQYQRDVIVRNIVATYPGKSLVGVNSNYGDTATISGITIVGDTSKKMKICERYIGNDDGDEPDSDGSGPDGTHCKYSTSDITYTNTPPASSAGGSSSTTKSSTTTTGSSSSTTGSSGVRYYQFKNLNSDRCMDVSGQSNSDGADVIQYSCSSSRNSQIWQLLSVGEGDYYYLINYKSGKYLDVENCGTADNTNVRQWTGLNNWCQQWQMDNAANGIWRFINRNSGKVLQVEDCSTSNNGDIDIATNENTDCQKWTLTRMLN